MDNYPRGDFRDYCILYVNKVRKGSASIFTGVFIEVKLCHQNFLYSSPKQPFSPVCANAIAYRVAFPPALTEDACSELLSIVRLDFKQTYCPRILESMAPVSIHEANLPI